MVESSNGVDPGANSAHRNMRVPSNSVKTYSGEEQSGRLRSQVARIGGERGSCGGLDFAKVSRGVFPASFLGAAKKR